MVSTRRTKRPSFGEAAAAPLAPASPATRSKRPRTVNKTTPATAPATPARRPRQQRQGTSRPHDSQEDTEEKHSEEATETATAADKDVLSLSVAIEPSGASVEPSEARAIELSDQHSTVEDRVEKEASGEAATAWVDEAAELRTAEEASSGVHGASTQLTEEPASQQADVRQTVGDSASEAEVEEDVDEEDEATHPRVRTAAQDDEEEEVEGESEADRREEDGDDSDDDDAVDDDDEYNFDVDHEPLAPPTTSQLIDEDDDEDDDDNLRAKEARRPSSRSEDDDDEDGTTGTTTKFGATLSALLQQPTASLASPLLAAAPLLPIPRDPTAAADRALRLKQRARREWRERAHRTDVQYDEVERRLVRLATRGVVQLFNAVQQQRRAVRMQAASGEKDRAILAGRSKQAEMSKEGFMQLIRTAPRVEERAGEEQKASGRDGGGDKGREEGKGRSGGWSVLNDDYMLGGKLTDWDKQMDQSEEEDEVEAQEEMEVE